MAVTDWRFAGAGASVEMDDGDWWWDNPERITASNNSRAWVTTLSETGAVVTQALRATDFGFTAADIPLGSVIVAVEVGIEGRASATGVTDLVVRLRNAFGQFGDNKADTVTNWPTSDTEAVYGGAEDRWGAHFISVGSVLSSDFGVDLRASISAGAKTVEVDAIRMRVYFSPLASLPSEPFDDVDDANARKLAYVEIDVDHCALTYGVSPCTAALGVTGERKCFNTLRTCQDRDNFTNEPVTIRFAKDAGFLPASIDAIPSIRDIDLEPSVISIGQNLGQRASVEILFADHPHSDVGFDKYLADRAYNPYERGTFWPKFRARQPYLRDRPLRLIQGRLGQPLSEMRARHYIIESFDGMSPRGEFRLVAKDPLKLADGDRAQAPALSTGRLADGIPADTTLASATLVPAGIGNEEYPSAGFVAIGGREICSFTRVGDVLSLVRKQLGTLAVEHEPGERVQVCLRFEAADPAEIIYELLANYAGIDSSHLPAANWAWETGTYLQRLFTATIPEPTAVNELISDLIEQAGLAVWWSDETRLIHLKVIRPVSASSARFDENSILVDTLRTEEQPDKRISQIWTYFGLVNPLSQRGDAENYSAVAKMEDIEATTEYGAAIKKVFAYWIPAFGRTTAERMNALQLGRHRDPPRRLRFSLWRGANVALGQGCYLSDWSFQDETGARVDVPAQVTSIRAEQDRFDVEADEMNFFFYTEDDLSNRVIVIESNTVDFNARTAHDSIYPPLQGGETITIKVNPGVVVGATHHNWAAFDVGIWPGGYTPKIILEGRIQGRGGRGSRGRHAGASNPAPAALPGGTALWARHAVELEINGGEIWGGGGGGGGGGSSATTGGGGGGGGAGYWNGVGGAAGIGGSAQPGANSTDDAGGAGGSGFQPGGNGGGPAQAGSAGSGSGSGAGGAAGRAVDGHSFVTYTGSGGDIRGAQVN